MPKKPYSRVKNIRQQSLDLEFSTGREGILKPGTSMIHKIERRHLAVASGVLLICCLAGLSYISYTAIKYSRIPQDISQIALVEANMAPVRVIPDDPGGIIIDNQDKLVYDNMTSNKRDAVRQVTQSDDNKMLRSPKITTRKPKPADKNRPLSKPPKPHNKQPKPKNPFDLIPNP